MMRDDMRKKYTHTHTHTHTYIYIYRYKTFIYIDKRLGHDAVQQKLNWHNIVNQYTLITIIIIIRNLHREIESLQKNHMDI